MSVTNVESFSTPRDSLPNVYTNVTAREVDFVNRFGANWDALRNVLGVSRAIRKAPGTRLAAYTATVALESGNVGAGKVIPYSKATITEALKTDITIEKYAKAVPVEDIAAYGAQIAIEKSDDAFQTQLQNKVLSKWYTFLAGGTLTAVSTTWQAALAKAQGLVLDKFATMQKDVTEVVGFANILDAYDYLGTASITVQNQHGLTYIENFMGYRTLFLLPAAYVARNTVYATPVENIDLYYVDPADADFARAGLQYTVQGETNLIGYHVQGNYSTAVGESYALMGMALWAEYIDGIAKVTVGGSMGSITAASAAGTTSGTKLTISAPDPIPADWTLYFAAKASSAYDAPSYGAAIPATFTKVTFVDGVADNVTATNGHKGRILAANSQGQCVADSGSINITA